MRIQPRRCEGAKFFTLEQEQISASLHLCGKVLGLTKKIPSCLRKTGLL